MSEKQYAMIIDTTRCIGCQTCVVCCKINHQIPGDVSWNRVETIGSKVMYQPTGKYPNPVLAFRPVLCNHCANPSCVKNCPTGAMHKDTNGIVSVNQEICIGCGYCNWACPYNAPKMDKVKNVMQKCTFCMERIEKGEVPYCVEACPGKARIFGLISDPNSELSKLIAAKHAQPLYPQFGTVPSVYYI
ncbi:Tetrathionate reductase subunit B [Sporomusa rhizae]|uniref:4Fe-4S dicluster domain-containing protein n=1 Tax=Sporomusa rhizae TaxID=357999 RepID=UPI00352AF7EE